MIDKSSIVLDLKKALTGMKGGRDALFNLMEDNIAISNDRRQASRLEKSIDIITDLIKKLENT